MKTNFIKSLFCCSLALAAIACTNNDNQPSVKEQIYRLSAVQVSPYFELIDPELEAFGKYWFTDMHLFLDSAEVHTLSQNAEPNTYMFGSHNDKRVTISDSCIIKSVGNETFFLLNRHINLDMGAYTSVVPFRTKLSNGTPIEFIRPYATKSDPIPFCYYNDMEIEWNADTTNSNGVVVLVQWHGTTVREKPVNMHIVAGDIFKDTGVAVLDKNLFNDIPDEALVNIWLLRANFCRAIPTNQTDDVSDFINTIASKSPYTENELKSLESILRDVQIPMIATGSIALLPIILIRNLNDEND